MDHLFRHHYGKMVSVLTRIFGLQHLELIEDAVQDTFISAIKSWRNGMPDAPEAWLTAAAKNRVLDLFRQISSEKQRVEKWSNGMTGNALNELFLDIEIADSQLRMIFAACNPVLKPQDQIAFALKTISGFSAQEIASALLLKEETIKKRLVRARKVISKENIRFEIPLGSELTLRLKRVMEVVYLIFNEGFHSNREDVIVREELCGEAMRLAKMLLGNKLTATNDVQALFALFCFHAARLKSKVSESNEVLSLKEQDRSLWQQPVIHLGHQFMNTAVEGALGIYHYEAAIAAEHTKALSYDETNWAQILKWYQQLYALEPSPFTQLNMATVYLQLGELQNAEETLNQLQADDFEQRAYLYHGLWAEYYHAVGAFEQGITAIELAISHVGNASELAFLDKKRKKFLKEHFKD